MAKKLTAKTKLRKGTLVSFYDSNIRQKIVGKVIRIKNAETPHGLQRLIYIMMREGFEAFGTESDFIGKQTEIISVDELIVFANDRVLDSL